MNEKQQSSFEVAVNYMFVSPTYDAMPSEHSTNDAQLLTPLNMNTILITR